MYRHSWVFTGRRLPFLTNHASHQFSTVWEIPCRKWILFTLHGPRMLYRPTQTVHHQFLSRRISARPGKYFFVLIHGHMFLYIWVRSSIKCVRSAMCYETIRIDDIYLFTKCCFYVVTTRRMIPDTPKWCLVC